MTLRFITLGAMLGGALGLLAACSNACDDALDKVEECTGQPPQGDPDCSDRAACEADCVLDASCDEITGKANPNPYADCVTACG